MTSGRWIAVYGAYGHTGRFVVAELRRRGWSAIACGRDAKRLQALAADFPGVERRLASIEDPGSLDRALGGTVAVINCAGPFLDTAVPVLDAALRLRIHYFDLSAEQQAALDTLQRSVEVKAAGATVIPAMAFYGGLADLLATAALDDWPEADAIHVAVALDSWHPTIGTRLTGRRNLVPRKLVSNGALGTIPDPPPTREWTFPAPFGSQEVVALTLSEVVTISRHVRCAELLSYMNQAPLRDLRSAETPPPAAADASGRSAQQFVVDVHVQKGRETRRAIAAGRDIYAVSAPLVVEALERVVEGRTLEVGAVAPGQAFEARDFLTSLVRAYTSLEIRESRTRDTRRP